MCGTCGCKIVYNGRFSDPEEQPVETYSAKKNKLTGKQILIIAGVVAVFVIVLIVAGASNRPSEKSVLYAPDKRSGNGHQYARKPRSV